jgi:phenylacetate-CoA ligase
MEHAYQFCPYYREIFEDIGATPSDLKSIEDLQKFPILTKELIKKNLSSILAKNIGPDKRLRSSTGGSTGQPLVFYRDSICRDKKFAMQLNFLRWCGFLPGNKHLYFWGASRDYDGLDTLKAKIIRKLATRRWFVNADSLKAGNFGKTIEMLSRLKPKIVSAYPNIIYAFAKEIERRKKHIEFDRIVVTAEQIFNHQRQKIEEVFNAEVFEQYGSREFGTIASECGYHDGLHYFSPGVILETATRDGMPSGNDLGSLLVTDLWNYAMPLIRYQVGDLVKLVSAPCECGCELPRIGAVAGRIVDAIIRPGGEMIAGQSLISVIRRSEIDARMQIIQKAPDQFIINYVSDRKLSEVKLHFIRNGINSIMEQQVRIDFNKVQEVERDKSGKFRYVKSDISSPLQNDFKSPRTH